MKDIMQKLAELEATAPKITKKKMLNEDSATPPINVSNKPASLKDMFETLSENIAQGQKPLPVLDPQKKQAGMGFVTSDNPAVQNILKNLDPKDVQIVQAPGQQPTGQQQQQQQSGQPNQAGATGQPQQGQMQMKEKDEGKPGKNFAKIAKSAGERYGSKAAGERVAGAVRAKLMKQGKIKEEQLDEISTELATQYIEKSRPDRGFGDEQAKLPWRKRDNRQFYGNKANEKIRAGQGKVSTARVGTTESAKLDEKFASQQQAKLMYAAADDKDVAKKTGVSQKVAKEFVKKSHGQKVSKLPKKVKEADIAPTSSIDTKGAGLGAGRSMTTLEGKKPDFLDLDKDGNKKESMKKAAADKKKKKVDESMNHRISAARLEGKSHGLRGHAHSGKRYEDLEEMKAYHEGYKEGLDECYGQGVYETAMPATVPGMADQEMLDELSTDTLYSYQAKKRQQWPMQSQQDKEYYSLAGDKIRGAEQPGVPLDRGRQGPGRAPGAGAASIAHEAEFDEGNAFTAALAKTPKGGKFSVGGKTFTDRTSYDAKVNEYAFESLDQQLNALLNESEDLSEGLSVSVSKGQQNSPDSVTITAQDAEADQLLQLVKHAGLGLFGDEQAEPSSAMSVQPSHGEPDEVGAGGVDVEVVDGNDGIMGLMQKLSGIQSAGADDYEDEEGEEEQLYGNHDHDQEETCNECGGMMEAGHSCGGKEMVDEVETEDQMEFEVSEDNAPDSDEAETSADEDAEAKEDAALAGEKEEEMNESFASILERLTKLAEGSGDKPKHPEHDKKDDKDFDDAEEEVNESKESTEEKDEKAEKAGKKVAKDIEYDEGHKGKDDNKAEKAGKKVTKDIEYDDKKDKKEKIDEWANEAGKKGTDASFEADIDFMTKVIAGGLNKPKSTGQTTVPVIAGQNERMHDHQGTVSDSVDDWVKLAGIK